MTTTREQSTEFRPRKLVPPGEAIIVHYSGKAPKVSVRKFNGEDVREVTFWLGIVDKAYPELVGQYHRFITKPWISAARTIVVDGKQKNISASKLYQTILAIAGQEKAEQFRHHDASLDITDPKYDTDNDNVDEEGRAKCIPTEWWKELRGFYVAIFKEPKRDKETGEYRLDQNGGIAWQEVLELKPLKFARITTKDQLESSVVWPLPRPEQAAHTTPQQPNSGQQTPSPAKPAGLGLPGRPGAQLPAPPKEPEEPTTPPEPPKPSLITEAKVNEIRKLKDQKDRGADEIKDFLKAQKVERVGLLTAAQADALIRELNRLSDAVPF